MGHSRLSFVFVAVLAACGGPDPRLIHGGGIGDGSIDGTLNVYVIDHDSEAVVTGATVEVGTKQKTTDKNGLAVFDGVSGAQTITVAAAGYRGTVWVKANGANVTIPVTLLGTPTPAQATLSGSIASWDTITVPTGHIKAAAVLYSQDDKLGDAENNIQTPSMGNICGVVGTACNWTVASRTGAVTLVAAIVDRDTKGTATPADDTQTIIGWATKTGLQVDQNVAQSGLVLDLVEAGNLENVTIDYGTPPAALPTIAAVVGIELSADEVVQLPVIGMPDTTLLAPKPTVFSTTATRRLTAFAQTASGAAGAQSGVIRHAQPSTSLAAGTWLDPPVGANVTRTNASFAAVAGALAHSVQWSDSTGVILEITSFDAKTTSFDVPSLVALPASGALTAKVTAIAADFPANDFSLDDDRDKLWGISAQPATVP